MNPDFQRAAVSYFGLPDGTMLIPSDPGHLAFHVVLDAETLRGIADRMLTLAEPAPVTEVPASFFAELDLPLIVLRERYNQLVGADKARYGSFGRYAATCRGGEPDDPVPPRADGRQVVHVDAPVEEDSGLPAAVWVDEDNLSSAQILLASDTEVRGGAQHWLIQVAMLDEAQKAKYAPETVKIMAEPGAILAPRPGDSTAWAE